MLPRRLPANRVRDAPCSPCRDGDPRPHFLASLLAAVAGEGSVVVHSSYKTSQLKALADGFPQHRQPIAAIEARLCDLEKEVVEQHVRHPGFHAGASINVRRACACRRSLA